MPLGLRGWEQLTINQLVVRAGLEPRTATLRVQGASQSATLPRLLGDLNIFRKCYKNQRFEDQTCYLVYSYYTTSVV